MLHCDCFNKDVDKRVTKISGSGGELDIEMAELILAYVISKSELTSDKSLMEIANAYYKGEYDDKQKAFVHEISTCIFDSFEIVLEIMIYMIKDENYMKGHSSGTRVAWSKDLDDLIASLKDGD